MSFSVTGIMRHIVGLRVRQVHASMAAGQDAPAEPAGAFFFRGVTCSPGEGSMTERRRGRVLLADDEALIRMGMRVILRDLGYDVVGEASDGQEAVEKVAALDPDVVIMDVKMPVMDGLEATRRIMAARPVPIIVLTAYGQQSLVEEAADAGVLAYLMKPVRESDIAPAIEVARARFADLQWLRQKSSVSAAPGSGGASDAGPRVTEATRILSQRYRLTETEAAARLRRLAKSSHRTMAEVADAIIALDQE
jgi:two-component system, response regulator PdtaR